ncbi:MAG: methyl-accepting chemotaxis protein [Deferribacteraceae bacterium]|jgi:methyl-accepting chemotaxis protein-2 (aspartate sensor receptor)|nr:methyl-accepting chemotaxis protein [Deferribacteraceae bacterium]
MKKLGLSTKLLMVIGGSMLVVFVILTFLIINRTTGAFYSNLTQSNKDQMNTALHMIELTAKALDNSLNTAAATALAVFSDNLEIDPDATMTVGDYRIPRLTYNGRTNMNDELDEFKRYAKADMTLFVRADDGSFIRAGTTLLDANGKRAVGTPLAAGAALTAVQGGRNYEGVAMLFGRQYSTRYIPMVQNSEVVGIYFVGVEFNASVEALSAALEKVKLGDSGYLYVMQGENPPSGSAGKGLLIVHPSLKGKSIWDLAAADGMLFSQEIAKQKSGVLEYKWLEGSETVDKIAVFEHYPEWDWLVIGTLPKSEMTSDVTAIAKITTIFMVAFLVILLAIIFIMIRIVLVCPLNKFIDMAANLTSGDGDLTRKIDIHSKDELGTLAGYFNTFIENVRTIIAQVKASADAVASSNNELAATMEELSTIFNEQSAQVEGVSSAMEEIRCVSDEASDTLNDTRTIITEADSKTGEGQDNLHQVVESINVIESRAQSLSNTIEALAEATNEIDEMLNVINDIAGQTNLLALNASIEAARAGEAGRGFAVVADEVRLLAERTQSSTLKIAEITTRVKAIPKNASKEVQETLASVSDGVERSTTTGDFFCQIVDLVNQINDSSVTMVRKIDEQCGMIERSNNEIKNVAVGIDESNKAVTEVTQTVHHLQSMTEELRMLAARFKV